MKKVLKVFLPFIFILIYALLSLVVYEGTDDEVFHLRDCLVILIGNVIIIVLLFLYIYFFKGNIRIRKKKFKKRDYGLIFLAIPGGYFLLNRMFLFFMNYIGHGYSPEVMELGEIKFFLFNSIFALTIAPVLEELLFRVCIVGSYHSFAGKVYGVISGALLFGYSHSGIENRLSSVILGLVFGIVFLLFEDVGICILLHSTVNFIIMVCGIICSRSHDMNVINMGKSIIYVNNKILIVSITVSVIALWILYNYRKVN